MTPAAAAYPVMTADPSSMMMMLGGYGQFGFIAAAPPPDQANVMPMPMYQQQQQQQPQAPPKETLHLKDAVMYPPHPSNRRSFASPFAGNNSVTF